MQSGDHAWHTAQRYYCITELEMLITPVHLHGLTRIAMTKCWLSNTFWQEIDQVFNSNHVWMSFVQQYNNTFKSREIGGKQGERQHAWPMYFINNLSETTEHFCLQQGVEIHSYHCCIRTLVSPKGIESCLRNCLSPAFNNYIKSIIEDL